MTERLKSKRNTENGLNDLLSLLGMEDNQEIQFLNTIKNSMGNGKKPTQKRSKSKKKRTRSRKPKRAKRADSISVKSRKERPSKTISAQNGEQPEPKDTSFHECKSTALKTDGEGSEKLSAQKRAPMVAQFPPLDKSSKNKAKNKKNKKPKQQPPGLQRVQSMNPPKKPPSSTFNEDTVSTKSESQQQKLNVPIQNSSKDIPKIIEKSQASYQAALESTPITRLEDQSSQLTSHRIISGKENMPENANLLTQPSKEDYETQSGTELPKTPQMIDKVQIRYKKPPSERSQKPKRKKKKKKNKSRKLLRDNSKSKKRPVLGLALNKEQQNFSLSGIIEKQKPHFNHQNSLRMSGVMSTMTQSNHPKPFESCLPDKQYASSMKEDNELNFKSQLLRSDDIMLHDESIEIILNREGGRHFTKANGSRRLKGLARHEAAKRGDCLFPGISLVDSCQKEVPELDEEDVSLLEEFKIKAAFRKKLDYIDIIDGVEIENLLEQQSNQSSDVEQVRKPLKFENENFEETLSAAKRNLRKVEKLSIEKPQDFKPIPDNDSPLVRYKQLDFRKRRQQSAGVAQLAGMVREIKIDPPARTLASSHTDGEPDKEKEMLLEKVNYLEQKFENIQKQMLRFEERESSQKKGDHFGGSIVENGSRVRQKRRTGSVGGRVRIRASQYNPQHVSSKSGIAEDKSCKKKKKDYP